MVNLRLKSTVANRRKKSRVANHRTYMLVRRRREAAGVVAAPSVTTMFLVALTIHNIKVIMA